MPILTAIMYPPPDQEVLEKLKNSPLLVVSFGLYVIHLTFDNGNRLSLAAPFRFSSAETIGDAAIVEFPLRESNMMRLLSHSVCDVRCDPDGSLELSFTNRDTLIVYANDPMYETYTYVSLISQSTSENWERGNMKKSIFDPK